MPTVILEAAESGVEPPGGDVAGEIEPGVEGTEDGGVGPPKDGVGEGADPETALICTFMPPEQ